MLFIGFILIIAWAWLSSMAAMEGMSRSLLPCIQSMLVLMFIMRVVVVAAMLLPVTIPSVLMARWIVSDGKNNTEFCTN